MSLTEAPTAERVMLGQKISNRLIHSMRGMRATTEKAALSIGELVNRIVAIATRDNQQVRETLQRMGGSAESEGDSGDTITHAIESQSAVVASFMTETREFFREQKTFVDEANEACDRINQCAASVSDLMVKSTLLALNMQIESARLGKVGDAFRVIGDEMKSFSVQVRQANDTIKHAMETLLKAIPHISKETTRMDKRSGEFSEQLALHLEKIRERTVTLSECMQSSLDGAEQRNKDVISCSYKLLSELQFQDPMAQELRRDEHDVSKLHNLIMVGECNDISLAQIEPAVGEDGREEREAGEIDLF